jgi:hypothetical protein
MELEFSGQILEKHSNIKFHENLSAGAEVFRADKRINMAKIIVDFRSFAKRLKVKIVL